MYWSWGLLHFKWHDPKFHVGAFIDFTVNIYFKAPKKSTEDLHPISAFIGCSWNVFFNGPMEVYNPQIMTGEEIANAERYSFAKSLPIGYFGMNVGFNYTIPTSKKTTHYDYKGVVDYGDPKT